MNITYNNAFAETLFIIKCLPYNEQNKISKKFINFLKENKNDNYVVNINPSINLQNQQLLEETKELLKEIYMSYFISAEERKRIVQYDKYKDIVEEDLRNKKYNSDNIFKNKTVSILTDEKQENSVALIEYKEPLFKRIFDRIKNFLKK